MKENELALDYYKLSRAEMNEHIKLQTQAILFFVSAVSVVYGLVYKSEQVDQDLALIIPFMSLCFSVIIVQRDFFMFSIASYCKNELEPFISAEMHAPPPAWDDSKSVAIIQQWVFPTRSLAHGLILILPGVYALLLNIEHLDLAWILGAVSLLLCAIMQLSILYLRAKKKS